jgi:ABC-type transport system substrate-binding protein
MPAHWLTSAQRALDRLAIRCTATLLPETQPPQLLGHHGIADASPVMMLKFANFPGFSAPCGSDRNYTGYCDNEVDALIDRQSSEPDPEKRRQLVWEIERRLARDASRPIIFYTRAATC